MQDSERFAAAIPRKRSENNFHTSRICIFNTLNGPRWMPRLETHIIRVNVNTSKFFYISFVVTSNEEISAVEHIKIVFNIYI